ARRRTARSRGRAASPRARGGRGPRGRAPRSPAARRRRGSDRPRARSGCPPSPKARRGCGLRADRARSFPLAPALGAGLAQDLLAHLLALPGEVLEPPLHSVVYGVWRELPARVPLEI